MLPDVPLPSSLATLLAFFRPCFTTQTFTTFCAMVYGMLAASGRRTVCDMLVGAGLSGIRRHDRAHRFFSHTAWSAEEVGLTLARLVVRLHEPPVVDMHTPGVGLDSSGTHWPIASDLSVAPTTRGSCSAPQAGLLYAVARVGPATAVGTHREPGRPGCLADPAVRCRGVTEGLDPSSCLPLG